MPNYLETLKNNGFQIASPCSCVTQIAQMDSNPLPHLNKMRELVGVAFVNRIPHQDDPLYVMTFHQYLVKIILENIKNNIVVTDEELYLIVLGKADTMYKRKLFGDLNFTLVKDKPE